MKDLFKSVGSVNFFFCKENNKYGSFKLIKSDSNDINNVRTYFIP